MLGVLDILFAASLIGGIWLALIGLFLRGAAQMSYRQLLIRQMLEGEEVRDFMESQPRTVPSSISLREFVEGHVYRHRLKMFPVVDEGQLLGCVSTKQLVGVPKEEWESKRIGDIVQVCSDETRVDPDTDAMDALARMQRTGRSRLVAAENGNLAGVLSLRDMMNFLSLKIELERGGTVQSQTDMSPEEPDRAEQPQSSRS